MNEPQPRETFRLSFNWQLSALVLLLLPLVSALGFWQLDRAEEKRQVKALYEQRQAAGPQDFAALLSSAPAAADWRHQPVSLTGRYIGGKSIFLDNKIHQGRFGYEIITPFKLAGRNMWVLVNRGWVAGDAARRSLPEIEIPAGVLQLNGEVYVPQKKPLLLASFSERSWPRVLQSVDVTELGEELQREIFPFVVRLGEGAPGAYQRNWLVVNIQPEKHLGYAFQWFAMAATLLLIALLGNSNLWQIIKPNR